MPGLIQRQETTDMNLGQRIAGALAALSGSTAAAVAANTEADATFRQQTEATLATLGQLTTEIAAQLATLQDQVDAGEAIDPAVFADIKAKIDSLDQAFPDAEAQPPEDDEPEEPIVDAGSAVDEEAAAEEG
jgi:hypothetical protein